jgi:hypothetical protein
MAAFQGRVAKREKKMRALVAAAVVIASALAISTSAAMADELERAHKQTLEGRDAYWNCLAEEYTRDSNKTMSGQDFTSLIANACPSERQHFRVSLLDYLSQQFPDADASAHVTTANNAIAVAQKDIVMAFVGRSRSAAPK